jgi:Glycosyl transferase family 11
VRDVRGPGGSGILGSRVSTARTFRTVREYGSRAIGKVRMITYRHLGRNGQLGNQLWEIASTIGIAHREGEPAGFPFWRYRPYFAVPDELFADLAGTESRDLGLDYLQDLSNFEEIEDVIRAYFRPQIPLWERLATRFESLLALPHKTSVHVRKGDYLTHNGFFVDLPVAYYAEAMSLTGGPYVVFSDDIAWCRDNLPGDCLFMERNRDYEDLFLMAACDEHIMANSTFSWWGAWLGGGRVVLPREWGPAFPEIEPRFVTGRSIVIDIPEVEECVAS